MRSFFRKFKKKLDEGFPDAFIQQLHWLLPYVLRYRGGVFFHLVTGIISTLTGLAASVVSKYLLDAVTGLRSDLLSFAILAMIGTTAATMVLHALTSQLQLKIDLRIQQDLQAEVYDHVLEADWESLHTFSSGDLMSRITNDIAVVAGSITGLFPGLITGLLQFAGSLGIMLYYDPAMAVIALLAVPFAALSSHFLVARMVQHSQTMKRFSSDIMSFYENSFSNLTSIKAFGIASVFSRQMKTLQACYREESLTYHRFSLSVGLFTSVLSMLVSGGCFAWGLYRLWNDAITFGSMVLFLQLAGELSGAFSTLTGMASSVISASTSAGRIMELALLPSEAKGFCPSFSPDAEVSIQLTDVTVSYQSGPPVLSGVSLEAPYGQLIGLIGPSGEGKTTLLRILLGLIHPQKGSAVLHCGGQETPLSSATRHAFAYVPQGNSVFSGTIEENLRLVKADATEEELEQVLRTACAWDFVQTLPGGLSYQVGSREKALSEGQAQRLAIARALLRHAPILLLDEATSALDAGLEKKLLHNLMSSGQIRTCLFITHRTAALSLCQRIYRVENSTVTRV